MKPEKVFRIGSVSASVFVNEIETEGGKRLSRWPESWATMCESIPEAI